MSSPLVQVQSQDMEDILVYRLVLSLLHFTAMAVKRISLSATNQTFSIVQMLELIVEVIKRFETYSIIGVHKFIK